MSLWRADSGATGFVCPRCGGALWKIDESGVPRFDCRIGDAFSAAELWMEHCAKRNTALRWAERVLAENAALARSLAEFVHTQGNQAAERGLLQEADADDARSQEIGRMLDGVSPTATLSADPDGS